MFLTLLRLLQYSQIIYQCLQASIRIFVFLKEEKLKYTYKGLSNKSLFFHEAFCKPTPLSPPNNSTRNATVKYQFSNNSGNIYFCRLALLFQFSAS